MLLAKINFFLADEETLDPMYGYLHYDGRITTNERVFLENFEDRIMKLSSESEVIDAFSSIKEDISTRTDLSSNFKQAFELGMNQAELAMVAAVLDKNTTLSLSTDNISELESRCSIEVCLTEWRWVIQVITVVIAVVSIVLAIFTLGFSLLLTTATIDAWVLVPVVVCSILLCPDSSCPGQDVLTCGPGFSLNVDKICFRPNATWVGTGLFSAVDANGNCPAGGFYTGSGGNLDCALGPISSFSGGIFSGLVAGSDFWANDLGAFHDPVCN